MLSWEFAFSMVISYLLGSLPFAYTIGKLNHVDVRHVGDSNLGAFNVFRHVGFTGGLLTLLLDIAKGSLAVVFAKILTHGLADSEVAVMACGIAALIGHNCPIFLNFHGGRGVSTVIGILLVLLPLETAICLVITVIIILVTKNSILGGITLFIPVPFIAYFLGEPWSLVIYSIVLPCISAVTHWLTIRRLSDDAKKESQTFWIAS